MCHYVTLSTRPEVLRGLEFTCRRDCEHGVDGFGLAGKSSASPLGDCRFAYAIVVLPFYPFPRLATSSHYVHLLITSVDVTGAGANLFEVHFHIALLQPLG